MRKNVEKNQQLLHKLTDEILKKEKEAKLFYNSMILSLFL